MRRVPAPARQAPAGAGICSSSQANGTPDDGTPDFANQFGWCRDAIVELTAAGHRLSMEVCRDESGDGRLTYNESLETDLVIRSGDKEVWRWSANRMTEGPAHSVEIGSSECVRWVVDWTDVDGSGRDLPPGEYRLFATTFAEELEQSPIATAEFRVT